MQILVKKQEDMKVYDKIDTCLVHRIHIQIKDIEEYAQDLIKIITDTSWIVPLGAIDQVAYEQRSKKTIEKIVKDILQKVDNSSVSSEFGEFMVSSAAQRALNEGFYHTKVPLAELWKEKIIGNPGFDFHTEGQTNLIAFGEAKYNGTNSPYTIALTQINDFVSNGKDIEELSDLKNFVTIDACNNCLAGKKAFAAAFSLNGGLDTVFGNLLKSEQIDSLLKYEELYLIAVEVVC